MFISCNRLSPSPENVGNLPTKWRGSASASRKPMSTPIRGWVAAPGGHEPVVPDSIRMGFSNPIACLGFTPVNFIRRIPCSTTSERIRFDASAVFRRQFQSREGTANCLSRGHQWAWCEILELDFQAFASIDGKVTVVDFQSHDAEARHV